MAYNQTEMGGKLGAIYQGIGTYSAPTGYVIVAICPNPSATFKATPKDTSQAYWSSDRTSGGNAVATMAQVMGQYSGVTVSAGDCAIYLEIASGNV